MGSSQTSFGPVLLSPPKRPGEFDGGEILCQITAFFDFTLASEYAILLITFAIILYTRKFPKLEDTLDELPMEAMVNQMSPGPPPSALSYQQHQQQPRRTPSRQSEARNGSRAPSVVGSVDGYRRPMSNAQPGFRPQRPVMSPPKRPGSVTGSIEGRLATSTPAGRGRQFMASSPLHEAPEEDMDLWDAASLDYPGRLSPQGEDWQDDRYEGDIIFFDEPRYHQWHYWLLPSTWLLALAMGVTAAMMVEHREHPLNQVQENRPRLNRPGCFVPARPFTNPHSAVVHDEGFNFTLSFVIIEYGATVCLMILMFGLLWYQNTQSRKYKRFLWILISCFVIFLISRSAMDIIQIKGLVEALLKFQRKSYSEYEYDVMLIWSTYIPLFLNPIVYLSFVSEYRQGAMKTLRTICGCQKKHELKKQKKQDQYKSEEIMSERSAVSKTQMSNML